MNTSMLEIPTALSHRRLVEAAILAPTPDNNQPWRFASQGDSLLVYLDRSRTLPSDVHSMFDLAGLGAAIENAAIAAREMGYETEVSLVPVGVAPPDSPPCTPEELAPVATLHFRPGAQADPLGPYLADRCTNRRRYSRRPIPQDVFGRIDQAASGFADIQLDWITDRPRIGRVARLVALGDRFRFQYEPFHREIYRQLRFTADEAERTGDGLDLRTLALPPGTALLLRLLRPWSRMRWVHRLRLTGCLTLPSLISVWHSGALGAISVPRPGARHYLAAGRAFQRLWLAATAEGLALQPLGSLPIFLAQEEQLAGRNLSPAHQRLAKQLREAIDTCIPAVAGRPLVMLFRTGYAPAPAVRSLRRKPEEVWNR